MTPLATEALTYLSRGWPVIPSRGKKKSPCVKWTIHQTQLPTTQQISSWDNKWHPERWGIVTGTFSGIVVIDFDGDKGREWLAKWGLDPHIRSGSGGYHVYFEHPGWLVPTMNSRSSDEWPFPGVDVRGDGGFIVLLGSNENGPYERVRDISPYPADELPQELRAYLQEKSKTFKIIDEDVIEDDLSPFEQNSAIHRYDQNPGQYSTDPQVLISRALQMPTGTGRNDAGFWLACQLRDIPLDLPAIERHMVDYQSRTPAFNAKGERELYTRQEAINSARSALTQPAREPWKKNNHYGDHSLKNNPHAAAQVNGAPAIAEDIGPEPMWEPDVSIKNKRQIAKEEINRVVAATDAAECWSDSLIKAIAHAGTVSEYDAIREFKKKYPKEFEGNIRGWQAKVHEVSSEIRKEEAARVNSPYLFNDKGTMIANVANAITMMRELPLAYDSFACRPRLTTMSPWKSEGVWSDYDDIKAAEWCQHQHLNINSSISAESANAISRGNPIHPVRDYLESLKWDKEIRLDEWLKIYMGCEDIPYVREVAAKWMIAAVSRIFKPGCQADYTLVFEGMQGKRKSSALRVLGGDWFTDDIADIGTKDSAMQLQGKWIIEISELDAFKKAEMTTIKAWLVRREDHFRPPYGRRSEDFPRQNVFAASTNKDDWGQDDSGLRRFWPVRTGKIDTLGLEKVRDQLWAEAYTRYLKGDAHWLEEKFESEAVREQAERQDVDAWRDIVEVWLNSPDVRHVRDTPDLPQHSYPPGKVFIGDILWHCLGVPQKDWNQGQKNRISRILRLSGYARERTPRREAQDDGRRPEFWKRLI